MLPQPSTFSERIGTHPINYRQMEVLRSLRCNPNPLRVTGLRPSGEESRCVGKRGSIWAWVHWRHVGLESDATDQIGIALGSGA